MDSGVITVQGLSKRFQRGERADSLYALVARRVAHPFSRHRRASERQFLALDEVSFDVAPGECLGVIGHNGAGKSTLLKLLAGIMRPDSGTIDIRGRVSALIEVGAGFHPALTGRENVFLNASILGMSRAEARRKFDAIVEFAGVGDYIDEPVKHYSSGMYARLGFAIAVHAEPDVLLVDEVLSVGDIAFRAKCIERMQAILRRGTAVVFVSHDLGTVQRFCDRTLVLAHGRTMHFGRSAEAIALYHASYARTLLLTDDDGSPLAEARNLRLLNGTGQVAACIDAGADVVLEYEVHFHAAVEHPSFGLSITRLSDRLCMYETSSTRQEHATEPIKPGEMRRVRSIFRANVAPGDYAIGIHVRDRDSLRYLIEENEVARLSVNGRADTGGPAHLSQVYEILNPGIDADAGERLTSECAPLPTALSARL